MADTQEADSTQTTAEVPARPAAAEPKKRGPRAKKAKAEAKPSRRKSTKPAAKASEAPAARTGRRTYSQKERAQALAQIERSIAGGASIKSAVGQTGISEQTYYQWKRKAASVSGRGELKDLLGLEEENKRLKKMLADRLREENAQLKKRLGIK